jgi:hypothetical protein
MSQYGGPHARQYTHKIRGTTFWHSLQPGSTIREDKELERIRDIQAARARSQNNPDSATEILEESVSIYDNASKKLKDKAVKAIEHIGEAVQDTNKEFRDKGNKWGVSAGIPLPHGQSLGGSVFRETKKSSISPRKRIKTP